MYKIPLFTDDIIQNGRWDLLRVNPMGCGTYKRQSIVPHWGRDQIAAFSQATYSKSFSWIKMYTFPFRFYWSMFPMVQLKIFQHWCRQWLGTGQATSRYLNQWCLVYWHIYTSLGPNELRRFLLHVIICESDLEFIGNQVDMGPIIAIFTSSLRLNLLSKPLILFLSKTLISMILLVAHQHGFVGNKDRFGGINGVKTTGLTRPSHCHRFVCRDIWHNDSYYDLTTGQKPMTYMSRCF